MGLFANILNRFRGNDIDWDDLEETLITGDLGIRLTTEIVENLRQRKGKLDAQTVVNACREEIKTILGGEPVPVPAPGPPGRPTVILVAGVNGVGKTTSVAKLAAYLKGQGHGVVLAAADTFRAAAIEQLKIWAERIDVPIVTTQYQGDPSAVCFDAHQKAIATGAAYLICDTAGRLHTRSNLMEELKKIRRTIAKQDESAPHERWIVVDATTGSNAVSQTREFQSALDLNGVIVTKLDGSGKGGSVVAIKHELGVSTRFIGTGETATDFKPFVPAEFVESLL
ncbi:MAG: signal recognition particle-docking protein FtsY [Verrucomicrobiales bacterium]|jgi:fused signal recognition particle receptor|nr:signal recognition particle-docking protein FtsY [Verrucomicrobiales bacterium]MBP9224545.1 signal recognition particle-docking protein FtsY [Verrucomicrobiales bacterium]HQZ28572.1 signal recognition particle-docking protein FtsY [Verrucomicrobiales bacterium]